jgi:hypothetical protein
MMQISKKIFIGYFIFIVSIILLCLLLDFVIITISFEYIIWISAISSFMYFSLVFFFRKISFLNHQRAINRELPYFLMNLANDLERNIPLKTALENRIDASILGQKISECLYKVNKLGYSLKDSLSIISGGSEDLQRAFYHIQDVVSSGSKNKADALRALANSLVEKQNHLARSYSTKLNFMSLMYIVVSAIVPAMFLMFLLVGSSFLELSFTPLTVVLVSVVLFPVLDMYLLLIMKMNMP